MAMTALTSLFSGSLLGIFGSVGAGILDYLRQKQANKHELDIFAAKKELAQIAATSAVQLENLAVLKGSYETDKATFWQKDAPVGILIIEMARGLTRPVLTLYLTIIASYIAVSSLREVEMTPEVLRRVAEYSIYSALELTGIALGYWFGSRGLQRIKEK